MTLEEKINFVERARMKLEQREWSYDVRFWLAQLIYSLEIEIVRKIMICR